MAHRNRAWADTVLDSATLAGSTQEKFDLLLGAPVVDTLTVTRLLIDFWYMAGPTNENEGLARVSVGIGVTSAEAFSAGIFPDPNTSTEYPPRGWIYVATQPALQALPTSATPTAMWRMDAHFKADIGAMRKIDKGKLFMVVNNDTISNALTLFRIGRVRALCLT